MSGPFPFSREAMSLDHMLASIGGQGWDGLEAKFTPARIADRFEPEDELKKMIAAFYQTEPGRKFFDWLCDLTLRAPPGHSGDTLESAGIAHAKHESRFAVGQSIFLAVAQGQDLLNKPKEPQT